MFFDASAEAKVDQRWRQVIQDHVLKFDIPMGNLFVVQILEGFSKGSNNSLAMVLGSSVIRLALQVAIQGNPFKVLHDNV